jgi:exosortase K
MATPAASLVTAQRKLARTGVPKRATLIAGALALTLAFGCKLGYAHASPTDLRWVLGPSCFVAERLGGLRFVWDPPSGFVSHGAHLVVGPPCAGVNFLVACSLALYFSSQAAFASMRGKLSFCALCFTIGYVATVAANGTRIALAASIGHTDFLAGFASHAAVHRLIGVVVYGATLLGLCMGASHLLASPRRTSAAGRIAIPVASYLGVALVLPLCHRVLGHDAPRLAEHVAQTSGALALVAALALVGERVLDRVFSRRARLGARS